MFCFFQDLYIVQLTRQQIAGLFSDVPARPEITIPNLSQRQVFFWFVFHCRILSRNRHRRVQIFCSAPSPRSHWQIEPGDRQFAVPTK